MCIRPKSTTPESDLQHFQVRYPCRQREKTNQLRVVLAPANHQRSQSQAHTHTHMRNSHVLGRVLPIPLNENKDTRISILYSRFPKVSDPTLTSVVGCPSFCCFCVVSYIYHLLFLWQFSPGVLIDPCTTHPCMRLIPRDSGGQLPAPLHHEGTQHTYRVRGLHYGFYRALSLSAYCPSA